MLEEIIEYIRKNRVSTTEVADCLGKSGGIPGLAPINRGHFCVGKVRWTLARSSSNWHVHRDLQDINKDEIVLIDVLECEGRAIIGELIAKYVLLYQQAGALVCCGDVRDAAALIRSNYSIWCSGFNPVGCFSEQPETEPDSLLIERSKERYDKAIAVCDDGGVVIIPKEEHTTTFLAKLENIEAQEDLWFERLDRHKESTFDIVCKEKILTK